MFLLIKNIRKKLSFFKCLIYKIEFFISKLSSFAKPKNPGVSCDDLTSKVTNNHLRSYSVMTFTKFLVFSNARLTIPRA